MSAIDSGLFKTLIRERCGLLFEDASEGKLVDALQQRSEVLGIPLAAYYRRLAGNEAEFQALVNLLTINETYFFREPAQIRLLVERLAPRFIAAQGGLAPVRILSAGCSSGEEPYSLAIALMEKYGPGLARWFAFFGGDIDSAVLQKARAARYSDFSFRGVHDEIRQRYFERDRRDNLLKEEVRNLVSFHEINLLAGDFSSVPRDFDIIFFRNVSIYFDTPTRERILKNLSRLMKDDGILLTGMTETLANDLGVMRLVEEDGQFYFAKGNPPLPAQAFRTEGKSAVAPAARPVAARERKQQAPPPPLVPPGDWDLSVSARPDRSVAAGIGQARQAVRDKRYEVALPLLDAVLAEDPRHTEASLLKAHVLLERKAFAEAGEIAQRVLDQDAWSIDALMLLGLAAKWSNRNEDAIRWFKQAVYARHECWPAHYFLADLLRAGGAVEPARRACRVVIQLLSGDVPDTGIHYLPLDLPQGKIRFLCECLLEKLPAGKMPMERI